MNDDLWSTFPIDPRERAHAGLRASDQDRDRITEVLSSAFADGRLGHDELEERMSAVAGARTLGELPPLVADLVPLKPTPARSPKSLVGVSPAELQRRAEDEWRERRRAAALSFLGSALVCWSVWIAVHVGTDGGDFPWPLIVNAVTLLNVVRVVGNHEQIVRERVQALEKKQARQQRWPKSLS
ncbi:DUF1707 SHOCT-like domain-containing protein [Nocardioides plantarum]|uniref:DUF1707 domain-containing protein n=1 Tax=Nocardioides plantarum TaxID=29299 RepID=A0ABV5K5D8_9ACTN|nr:DUF1707 domain-containing protein [Nocardioides plantarum]